MKITIVSSDLTDLSAKTEALLACAKETGQCSVL